MKHILVTLAAIMALIAARGAYAADEHKGHEHMHDHAQTPAHTDAGTHGRTDAQTPATYKCPMHPEVTTDKAGKCPKCGMNMAKGEEHIAYRCPMHKDVTSDKPGKCPKCNMNMEMDKDHGGTKSR